MIMVRNVNIIILSCWFLPLLFKDLLSSSLLCNWKSLAVNIFPVHIKKCVYFLLQVYVNRSQNGITLCDKEHRIQTPCPSPPSSFSCPPVESVVRVCGNLGTPKGNGEALNCLEAVSPTPASGFVGTQALAKTITLVTLLFWLENASVLVLIKIDHNLA